MNPDAAHPPDPLLDEVRDRRRQVSAQFDHDVEKLFDELRRRESEHPDTLLADYVPHVKATENS
jgi:hypothetical protein